jgi:hypothetical protein
MKVEKRDLLVIGKSKNPQCLNPFNAELNPICHLLALLGGATIVVVSSLRVKCVRSLPLDYYSNTNAWMTSVIFNDWLVKLDLELKLKLVLSVDNCTAHTNNSLLKNFKVIFLPANTTSLIQPCDHGTIRAFKALYHREMHARIIAELNDIQDQSDASAVAKKISLLDALHLVAMLWKRVSEKTIENCFRKGGFSKTMAETHAFEECDLTCEIFDQAPDGMSKE